MPSAPQPGKTQPDEARSPVLRPRLSQQGKGRYGLTVAGIALVGAALVGVLVGAADLPAAGVVKELLHLRSGLSEVDRNVLWELRVPRVLAGALVGGLLSIAGAGYQGVFRNPLADPYLLGAGAGAGLGATLAIGYSPVDASYVVPIAAFAGAVGGVALAVALGRAAGSSATLLLSGIAVTSFLSAVQTFVQQSKAAQLQRIYAWIMGGLGGADWSTLRTLTPYATVAVAGLLLHGRLLDVLGVGDEEAAALGVSPRRVRLAVLTAASLATAAAVSAAGLIGFVGVVVPHAVRRLAGSSYRVVLPISFLAGGSFLILSDVLARTLLSPAEVPLGVVTAFIGAPSFVLILRSTTRSP